MANIKIIDDNTVYAENLSIILRKEGHTVSHLDHVDGAVEELVQNTPDLLILDVMFPELPTAGFHFARKVRGTQEIKDLPIILLTGVNQELPVDFSPKDIDGDWIPVQDFVEKTANIKPLIKKVSKLLKSLAK